MSVKVKHRRPSVLFVNRVYPPVDGASGRVLRELARGFAKSGWDVCVVTSGEQKGVFKDGPVRVVRVKHQHGEMSKAAYLSVWAKLFWTCLSERRHDLVVSLTDPPMTVVLGGLVARYKKSKHIHWCHDLYPDLLRVVGVNVSDRIYNALYQRARRAMSACDRVVVIGRCMGRHLAQSGISGSKITVIPNWPDRSLTGKARGDAAAGIAVEKDLLDCHGQPMKVDYEPKFRILYAGNLGRAHPIETILDAAMILNVENPEVEFVFVGSGVGHQKLAAERARRGLDNIRFMPYQPVEKMKAMMQGGDVHLITMDERAEGLLVPCKIYSALAAKRPSIFVGPEGSEAAKVLRDFHAGSVVAQGDAQGLVDAVRRYRLDGGAWFSAHEGAAEAARIFLPDESIKAWIQRAGDVVGVTRVAKKAEGAENGETQVEAA